MHRPLAGLTKHNLAREFLAGITLIAIAVPLNIGYAQIAGLPATAGLYALVLPSIVYALVVSSRQLVASPDAAAAALVASSIGGLAIADSENYVVMAMAQAVICGVMLLLLAYFKLGFLANFLSKPILVGFVGGLAFDILVSQVAKMLGISLPSGAEFVEKIIALVTGLPDASGWSLLIAGVSVGVLLLGKRLAPAVPWALVVLVVATVVVVLTSADQAGVAVLGEVPAGPPALTWPVLAWMDWFLLIPSAMALTLVTTAEGLLVSRSYGEKRHYATSPNRDLAAFGLANIAAGASASFAVGASTSRTAAMDQAGSRTQLPSLILAGGALLLLLFGTALLADIPSPAIGAIVGVAVLPLLGIAKFRDLWRLDRFEFFIGLACFLVTLLVGSIPGILVAFVLALVHLAKRASAPAIDVLAANGDPQEALLNKAPEGSATAPGLLVVRLGAPLFFANGSVFDQAVKTAIDEAGGAERIRHLVIDMEAVNDVDVTGAEAFESLRSWLDDRGITLAFSRVRPDTEPRLQRLGIIRGDTLFSTNREAVDATSSTLGSTTPDDIRSGASPEGD
ncbi:SulP family inorganic anion transporter [Cellulosimicrobium funkei]|nr:SulP family inorganic anion transporter [Cellulosimicrobium funkei]